MTDTELADRKLRAVELAIIAAEQAGNGTLDAISKTYLWIIAACDLGCKKPVTLYTPDLHLTQDCSSSKPIPPPDITTTSSLTT